MVLLKIHFVGILLVFVHFALSQDDPDKYDAVMQFVHDNKVSRMMLVKEELDTQRQQEEKDRLKEEIESLKKEIEKLKMKKESGFRK